MQRTAGNAATARLLQRRASVAQRAGAAPAATPKFFIDLPDTKLVPEFGKTGYVLADVKMKGKVSVELQTEDGESGQAQGGATANKGVKLDYTLAKKKATEVVAGIKLKEETKEKLSFELSAEKLDVSYAIEGKIAHADFPDLQGTAELKGVFAGIKWKDAKDLSSWKVLALEGSIGLNGDVYVPVADVGLLKISVAVTVTASARPNWPKILQQAAKMAAEKAAQWGVTSGGAAAAAGGGGATIPVSAGAAASAAAAIALPAMAAAMMVAGMLQMEKNIAASHAATGVGVPLRQKIKTFVNGYASVMCGGKGSGPGAEFAEQVIANSLTAHPGLTREQLTAEFSSQQGGQGAFATKKQKEMRDSEYSAACIAFDAKQDGWLESIGEDWGARGVFRRQLKLLLYSDVD